MRDIDAQIEQYIEELKTYHFENKIEEMTTTLALLRQIGSVKLYAQIVLQSRSD